MIFKINSNKKGAKKMNTSKEIQEEMIGVLTAISIVSKRLASKIIDLDKEKNSKKGELENE
jgi:hypothetical protein